MEWVLNNLENVIIPIIIMILYGLGNVGQRKKKKDEKQAPSQSQPQTDPNEARRVREIQEEIRRKIAERTGRTPPPATARQTEVRQPAQPPQRFPTPSRTPTPPPPPVPVQSARSYEDELKEKQKKLRELQAQADSVPDPISRSWDIPGPKVKMGELRGQIFADLKNPLGQKKAILVSEILGSPVGIKGPSGWKANV